MKQFSFLIAPQMTLFSFKDLFCIIFLLYIFSEMKSDRFLEVNFSLISQIV